jgi:putative Mn2+ efflux pump MntP
MKNPDIIASHWYQERYRQAQLSFNVAVCLAGATTILSLVFAVSMCMSKISEATAAAGLGLTSGAISTYCFKLSDDANTRLDATAKELLEE